MYNQIRNKQEQMYIDIVQLVADIAKEGFGIDIVHNPLFSGVFQQQLSKHHSRLEAFIYKYAPVEIASPVTNPSERVVQQVHTNPQPVNETIVNPWPQVANSEQSG